MGFNIGVVHYSQFGPFGDARVDFSQPGLTMIEGAISGKRGCDSNGAGKSMLFDGVCFALFGRPIRSGYTPEELVKLNSHGGMSVTVNLTGGEFPVVVTRYRAHTKFKDKVVLTVNGADCSRGTSVETTAAIEQLIGMDRTAFLNYVAFGVREDVKSFFSSTDADKKTIMSKLLGLELYAEAEKVARRKLAEVTRKLQDLTTKKSAAEAAIAESKRVLESMENAEPRENIEFSLTRKKLEIKMLGQRIESQATRVKTARTARESEEESARQAERRYQTDKDKFNTARRALEERRSKSRQQIGELEGQRGRVSKQVAKMKGLSDQSCPTCGKTTTKAEADKILAELDGEDSTLANKVVPLELDVAAAGREIEALVEPKPPKSPALETARSEENTQRGELTRLQQEQNAASEMYGQIEAELSRLDSQTGEITESIGTRMKELETIGEDYTKLSGEASALEFWSGAFGNAGIKSFLIEAEMPELNRLATGYAQRLLGEGAYVRLKPTRDLKSRTATREELVVDSHIPDCTNSYGGASTGQKKRLNLSLILAFRDLLASRIVKPFKQMFVDELLDGMDKSGVETVVQMLRELAAECPVTLITHDSRLKAAANRVIRVKHERGTAII